MKISVIVPVYNMEPYIRKSIDSLLNQTVLPYEIILINDGSTDNCGAICDEYDSVNDIISTYHKENGGLSSARNYGIEKASGSHIIFPDPDDWVDEDYIENFLEMKNMFSADLYICGHYVADDNSQKNHNKNGSMLLTRDIALEKLLLSNYYCGFSWNKLYSIKVIKDGKLYFENSHGMAQDLFFAFKYFCLIDSFYYDPTPKYHYYQHHGSVTNSRFTKRKFSGLKTFYDLDELAIKKSIKLSNLVKTTIANLSLTLLFSYFESNYDDKSVFEEIKFCFKKNYKYLFRSTNHNWRRKLQGSIAYFSPEIYFKIKNRFRKFK